LTRVAGNNPPKGLCRVCVCHGCTFSC
jgi:hypothetical protein